MDLPFQPSGWDTEARELMAESGYSLEEAVEAVTLRYLREGYYQPLFDSVRRGHVHGAAVMAYVAAMCDPKHRTGHAANLRYEFGVKEQ
jgi:hypothetical protein